jgi:hypothetical protein
MSSQDEASKKAKTSGRDIKQYEESKTLELKKHNSEN